MRIIAVLVLVFGVALSGGALFFASQYFNEMKASMAQRGPETVRVLVAKHKLDYGAKLKAKDLQWVEWPKSAVPPGSFTSVEALLGKKGNEHRVVLRTIEPGEPVLASKITKKGESPRMSMNLAQGKRAVAISVDATAGVAGFVGPGDRVDIMLIRSIDKQLVSSVIMQDVPVIAVDQRTNTQVSSAHVFRMVTVEVDTTDAQKLALAQQLGRLTLTLRGMGQNAEGKIKPVTEDQLNDFSKPASAAPPMVRVRRGTSVTDVNLQDPTTGQPADANAAKAGTKAGGAAAN